MIIEEVEDKIEDLMYHSAHEDMSLSVDYLSGWNDGILATLKVIADSKPLADAEPVRHGYWISDEDGNISCSECGQHGVGDNYCEKCGAKMDEVME